MRERARESERAKNAGSARRHRRVAAQPGQKQVYYTNRETTCPTVTTVTPRRRTAAKLAPRRIQKQENPARGAVSQKKNPVRGSMSLPAGKNCRQNCKNQRLSASGGRGLSRHPFTGLDLSPFPFRFLLPLFVLVCAGVCTAQAPVSRRPLQPLRRGVAQHHSPSAPPRPRYLDGLLHL